LQKATISFVMSICPSVRPSKSLSVPPHGTTPLPLHGYSWYLIFDFPSNVCRETSSFIKSGKNNRYCTWRPVCIYDKISLSSSKKNRRFRQSCRENKNTHFMSNTFFSRKSCRLWGNVEKYVQAIQVILWPTRVACCIPMGTNTRSQCVISIAFPQHTCSRESPLMIHYSTLPLLAWTSRYTVCILGHVMSHSSDKSGCRLPNSYSTQQPEKVWN
jgi:hypothetical protein